MPEPVEPSLLHRMFRIRLGHAPPMVFGCGSDCGTSSVFFTIAGFMAAVVFYTTMAGFRASPHWLHGLWLLPMIVVVFRLSNRFESRERFARARIRRGECFGCGEKLENTLGNYCETCSGSRP